jgi:hypothetical protein
MRQCAAGAARVILSKMPQRDKSMLSPSKAPAANLADMAGRVGASVVAAAWPTGLGHLGLMVSTCETCDAAELCRDWLARAPKQVEDVPPFCPNAAELRAARRRG